MTKSYSLCFFSCFLLMAFGACGQGNVDFEICDNNIDDEGDGLIDCDDNECAEFPDCIVCGDGIFAGDEQCDDGNNVDGDGCAADCTLEDNSTVVSVEDLNGVQPAQAVFSVFGEGDFDTDSDGIADSRALVVFTSDNPDICNVLEAETLGGTTADLIGNRLDGEAAITVAFSLGSLEPFAAETVIGDFDQGGDFLVDAGFQVTANGSAIADTLFNNAGNGTLTINAINDFTLSGDYVGAQLLENVTETAIDIELQGNFVNAQRCPAIDIGVGGLAQTGYQL